jgi:hypothetical protein
MCISLSVRYCNKAWSKSNDSNLHPLHASYRKVHNLHALGDIVFRCLSFEYEMQYAFFFFFSSMYILLCRLFAKELEDRRVDLKEHLILVFL